MFDAGWDVYREQTFARQKELGVVPPMRSDTPPGRMPAWNSLSENQKSLYARPMEVYAVYQETPPTWAASWTSWNGWGHWTTRL